MVWPHRIPFVRPGVGRPGIRPASAFWWWVGSLPLALFLSSPLLIMALYLLRESPWHAAASDLVRQALVLTVKTSAGSTLLAIGAGTPLAYLLARRRFPGKALLEVLVELPVVIPPTAAGVLLLLTFGRRGALGPLLEGMGITLPFTPAGVVVAQLFISTPFYIRGARLGFMMVPRELEEAAAVDGASTLQILRQVTLPLAFPGLFSGLLLCWARAVGEFGATYLFAGNMPGHTQTMPLAILTAMERDLGVALLLTGMLTLFAFGILLSAWLLLGSREDILPAL
ncbi:ABC transporter permease [Thermoflexus sp.]|uniref:ABC transporter permease n=1 Tax=Thermoflexus sp. TaxID=1969742 RepID=UPI0035E4038A